MGNPIDDEGALGRPQSSLHERTERSLPGLLLERMRAGPDEVAFREKRLGVYKGYTWSQLGAEVEQATLGLKELGVKSGDRVVVMGDACIEWVVADYAIMAAGAVTVGIYATCAPSEVAFILSDCVANVVILETQEHLDKLLPVLDQLPDVSRFVVIDTRALFMFEHPMYLSFEELRELGARRSRLNPGEFEETIGRVGPADLATIIYTSGTTSNPKGVMTTHQNLLLAGESFLYCKPEMREQPHRVVAHLPLAHGVGRVIASIMPLQTALVPFFCEEIDEFAETIREVAPNFALLPPRFWEKMAAQLLVSVDTGSRFKRRAYLFAAAIGKKVVKHRYANESIPLHLRLLYWLARQLVFKQILEKVGMGRIEIAFTGSAPMPPHVTQVWHLWGVDLREMYGLTECFGVTIAQFHRFPEPGDIGEPTTLETFEFKLAEDGEMMLRSPAVCAGYWNRSDLWSELMTADGWLHTGDIAERTESGAIRLVDRRKDIMITAGGKNVSPQQIEKVLKGSPYVSEGIAIGEGRRYVTALLMLDYTTVSEWAQSHNISYTSYTNLVTRPEVETLMDEEVRKANQFLARVEQIKYFRIIPQELDPEEGETTPNFKIKRSLISKMFSEQIESMYEVNTEELFEKAAAG